MCPNRVDDEFLSRPVLVYGPRKAGTTLLQSLLDGGSALLMVPGELKLKVFVRKPSEASANPVRLFLERGRSFFPALFNLDAVDGRIKVKEIKALGGLPNEKLTEIFDSKAYAARLSDVLGDKPTDLGKLIRADVTAFVEALRDGRGTATRWASKEVGGDSSKVLELFLRHFPQGQIVYVVRQPEFIVRSIILDRRRKGRRLSIRKILHECEDAEKVVNHGYERLSGNGVVVAYEDLTTNVPAELMRICRTLDIPFEEILTGPTTLGQSVVVTTSSRQTQDVFRQAPSWQKDLSWREVMIVRAYQVFAPLWHSLRGGKFVRYDVLISALKAVKDREAA